MCECLRQAELGRLPRVVSIQNAYNLTNRTFEIGLSEVARRAKVPLLAYSPLAFGHLTGKHLDGVKRKERASRGFRPSGRATLR